jgi:phosphohistidine swiveling domain-containing protein
MAEEKEKFTYISGRKMYYYIAVITSQGYYKIIKKYARHFRCPLDLVIILKNDYEDFWFTTEKKQYEKLSNYYLKHGGEILKFVKLFNSDVGRLRQEIEKRITSITRSTDQTLKINIKKIFLMIRTDINGVTIARRLDEYLLPHLRQGLMEAMNKSKGEADALIASFVKSPYLSYQTEEKNIFWQRFRRLKKTDAESLERFFDKHLEQYGWVNVSYYDEPPLSKKELWERVKQKPSIIKSEKIVMPTNIPSRYKKIISILSLSAYLKDFLRGKNAELIWLLEPYFKELSRRFNLPISILKSYSPEEIYGLLNSGKRVSAKKLRQRQNLTVFFKDKVFESREAEKIIQNYNLIITIDNAQTVFSGRTACPGKARGEALVVKQIEDIKRSKTKKFILVVQNTNPAFVPYLGRVAGIVAEEGGVTTHVSLIAREFKIPTVVGVPNITIAIKTGDLVEVDADKGIVKIIK